MNERLKKVSWYQKLKWWHFLLLGLLIYPISKLISGIFIIYSVFDLFKNEELWLHACHFVKHWTKEIVIALILAMVAAIAVEVYKSDAYQKTIAANQNAVATILAFDKDGNPVSQGSGIFINSSGLLATNYHIIKGTDIKQTLAKLPSGAFYKIRGLRGSSSKLDIALLQFDANDTPHVKGLGDSDELLSGEKVIAIGSPLGQENSISEGVIANPSRERSGQKYIQFTAAISPGSSGGGLFKEDGNVIGITTATLVREGTPAQNINYAIPVNLIKDTLSGTDKKLTDNSAEYYYSIATLEDNDKKFDKAIEDFQKALAINEKYSDAYLGLGGVYYEKGDYNSEVENYEHAVQYAPDNHEYWYYLATAYEDTEQYQKAAQAYAKAISLKPDDSDALHDYAILLIAGGDCSTAKHILSKLNGVNSGQAKELTILLSRSKCSLK